MIKNFTPRLYQQTILGTAAQKNTLVVLPTGLGKTNIFLMLAAHRLKQHPNSKILLLGPTRPLIDQYYKVFLKHFEIEEENMAVFTGFVSPEKRKALWEKATIIFSTPQAIENDILSNRISIEDVSLLGIDEAHRAVGDYSYVFIAKHYHKKARYPRILALTASPGSEVEKIKEVCKNLHIEEVEVRTEHDPDVKPYIKEIELKWISVELPEEFKSVKKLLEGCFNSKIKEIRKKGLVDSFSINKISKKDLLALQNQLRASIMQGSKDYEVMKALSLAAEAMKVQHALELLETQGITALHHYMKKLQSEAKTSNVKAVKNLVKDLNFRTAFVKTEALLEKRVEHPKLEKLKDLVKEEVKKPEEKIIIFNQYRDNALMIVRELEKIEGASPRLFVGQQKKGETGISQKEQIRLIEEFRKGQFNILVATAVGEEGLDIPQVDLVVFYEPIPSAIRHIQRRGRTGRLEKGRVVILTTKNTRDEAYRWTAFHKEKRMHKALRDLKQKINSVLREKEQKRQKTLAGFVPEEEKVKVFADVREKGSGVIKELLELGVSLELTRLDTADYQLSSRVGVEFKTVQDLVDSMIDGRLLDQVKTMKEVFERPLILVEGSEDIYSVRNVHPNAVRGMLATIAVSYGVPIIQTRNPKETAALLWIIARREQESNKHEFSMHGSKKPMSKKELQEYIVSALPGVGPTLAKPLLRRFKSVKKIVNASEEQLKKIDLIGEKKAKKIRDVLDSEYEEFQE